MKKPDAQIQRFKAKAKELGADENAEVFDRAFKKAVPERRPRPDHARKNKSR